MREESTVLRGHHLLCIQGFRGYGYSDEFVEGMGAVINRLRRAPETPVELVDSYDEICLSCPHLRDGACKKGGEETELTTATHDWRVLSALGLQTGQRMAWSEVLDIIRASVTLDDLPALCRDCEWASLGYCAAGLRALLSAAHPPQADSAAASE